MNRKMGKSVIHIIGCFALFLLAVLLTDVKAYAAPACPSVRSLTLSDGRSLLVTPHGDEFFNWYEDSDGYAVLYNQERGKWYYARREGNKLLCSSTEVGTPGASSVTHDQVIDMAKSIKESNPLIKQGIKAYAEGINDGVQNGESSNLPKLPKTNQELLLVLVQFNDCQLGTNGEYWSTQYFENDLSVARYYKDMAGGLDIFVPAATQAIGLESPISAHVNYVGEDANINDITWVKNGVNVTISSDCDGVIKVVFDMNHPIPEYLGIESSKIQIGIATLALKAIKEQTQYDFTGYGVDKLAAVIVAGIEQSNSRDNKTKGQIWAQSLDMDNSVIGVPGVSWLIGNGVPFIMHGEKFSDGDPTTIGVPCHELGHALGLPDLYSVSSISSKIGHCSLMASGLWAYDSGGRTGARPAALDAWSKYVLGYITPIECEEHIYDIINVNSAGDIGEGSNKRYNVLKLCNSSIDKKQYFLVENRQLKGWDAGILSGFDVSISPGPSGVEISADVGGILIWQVDENIPLDYWFNCSDDHPGVSLIGGSETHGERNGRFYAINRKRSEFLPNHTPNSRFYASGESNPRLNPRTQPSNITMTVNDPCFDSMEVEVGVDGIIPDSTFDANFLKEVRTALGKTEDAPISKEDLWNITTLDVSNKYIYNLNGMEYFRQLKEFYCYFNDFTSLDMSGNPELEVLDCSLNPDMTFLDISNNVKLSRLECNFSGLHSLDTSRNPNLETLICYESPIEKLDLSRNPKLKKLDGWANRLSTLDVSQNSELTYLDCSWNYMHSIDDVIGWEDKNLILGETFIFDPQDEPVIE